MAVMAGCVASHIYSHAHNIRSPNVAKWSYLRNNLGQHYLIIDCIYQVGLY